jgi:hypothetical protein
MNMGYCILYFCLLLVSILPVLTETSFSASIGGARNSNQFSIDAHKKSNIKSNKLRAQGAKIQYAQTRISNLNDIYSQDGTRFQNNSLQLPNQFLSYSAFGTDKKVKVLTEQERLGKGKCSFIGALCPTETTEHELTDRFFEHTDSVLEVYRYIYSLPANTKTFTDSFFMSFRQEHDLAQLHALLQTNFRTQVC